MDDFLDSDEVIENFKDVVDSIVIWSLAVYVILETANRTDFDFAQKLYSPFARFSSNMKFANKEFFDGKEEMPTPKVAYSFLFFVNDKLQKDIKEIEEVLDDYDDGLNLPKLSVQLQKLIGR